MLTAKRVVLLGWGFWSEATSRRANYEYANSEKIALCHNRFKK